GADVVGQRIAGGDGLRGGGGDTYGGESERRETCGEVGHGRDREVLRVESARRLPGVATHRPDRGIVTAGRARRVGRADHRGEEVDVCRFAAVGANVAARIRRLEPGQRGRLACAAIDSAEHAVEVVVRARGR